MKKENKTLESYYQTENEWHNDNIIELIAEAKEAGNFENITHAVESYSFGLEHFYKTPEAPLKVIATLVKKFEKLGLDEVQALLVLEKLKDYIRYSKFDDEGIEEDTKKRFLKIFKAEVEMRKAKVVVLKPQKPLVKNLRSTLKVWVQQELERLPETLEELEPEKRVSVLCKFLPFVLPKVQTVHSERDEDDDIGWPSKW